MSRRKKAIAVMIIYVLALPFIFTSAFGWLETAEERQTEKATGIWGDPHIGVVADTTQSMGPALNALATAWQTHNQNRPMTGTFHLATFKDDANYAGSTTMPGQFGNWLNNLQAKEGGDCPDNALAALLEMARQTPNSKTPTTNVLLTTDASPRGGRTAYTYVSDRLLDRGLRVYALINGWCPNPPVSPVAAGFLAMATGGKYIPTDASNYLTDTLIALSKIESSDRIFGTQGMVTPGNPQIFDLKVDSTMSTLGVGDDDYYDCLTCIVRIPSMITPLLRTSATVSVEIHDPQGNVIGPTTPGYRLLVNDFRRYQEVYPPGGALVTGTWTVHVSGDGIFSLDIFGHSTLHLAYPGEHTLPTGSPIPFRAGLVTEMGTPGIVTTATFAFVSMDGQQVMPIHLFDDGKHGDGAAGDGLYGGWVERNQQGCWMLTVRGTLSDGSEFNRLYPAPIRFRGFNISKPGPSQVVPGTTRAVNFSIANGGASESSGATTFDLAVFSEQGWAITNTVPASITLQPGEVYDIAVEVVVPANASPGAVDEVVLVAAPVTDIGLSTAAVAEVGVVAQIRMYLPSISRD